VGNPKLSELLDRGNVTQIDGGLGLSRRAGDRRSNQITHTFLILSDLCLVWMSAALTYKASALYLRFWHFATPGDLFPGQTAGFLFLFSILVVLLAHTCGLYTSPRSRRWRDEIRLLGISVLSAAVLTGFCLYLWNIETTSKELYGLTIAASWVALAAWRKLLRSQAIEGLTEMRNVLIVGCGPNGAFLRRHLEQNPELGYVFKGYVDRRQTGRSPDPKRNREEADILGTADKLVSVARAHFIDEVFISVPNDRHLVEEVARHARTAQLQVRVVPDLCDGLTVGLPVEYVGGFPTMTLHDCPIPTIQLILKRFVDLLASTILLILLAPFLLAIMAVIKLDSKGPLFYASLRIGKKGRTFVCHKFRTMVANADDLKESLRHLNQRDTILFKIRDDPRITRVGRWLRKFSIDELPQLWNVFKGEMSLVGPRPPVPGEYNQYALEHLRRLVVAPGVTGLWQVRARRNPSFASYIQLDREYVDNWSLWLDCKILWETIPVVLAGTGE
jgi:exopolysaccharide biosynthesis polyprenyl glycosylphosphotransferase